MYSDVHVAHDTQRIVNVTIWENLTTKKDGGSKFFGHFVWNLSLVDFVGHV